MKDNSKLIERIGKLEAEIEAKRIKIKQLKIAIAREVKQNFQYGNVRIFSQHIPDFEKAALHFRFNAKSGIVMNFVAVSRAHRLSHHHFSIWARAQGKWKFKRKPRDLSTAIPPSYEEGRANRQ